MRHGPIGFAALALVFTLVGQTRADNIVINGGFETGNFAGWDVSGGFTVVDNTNHLGGFGPHGGEFYAALGTVGRMGSVSQLLNTTPGQMYTLDFFLANDGDKPNRFKVIWDGSLVFDQKGIPRQDYTEYTFQVTASGALTKLSFMERNDPGYLSLDDVSVTPVVDNPEPGGLTLLALGGLGIVGYAGAKRALRRR
jgi:hypothetical protein